MTEKRKVNSLVSLVLGIVLIVLCSILAGVVAVLGSGRAGIAVGIFVPLVVFIVAIRWGGLRMIGGLMVGACAAVFVAMAAQHACWVAFGDDAGRIRVEEALAHVDAVSFEFIDAEPRPELTGYHIRSTSDSSRSSYVFPLVAANWQRSEPVTVWVASSFGQPSFDDLQRRVGIRVFDDEVEDYRNAVADAEQRYQLRSVEDALLVQLVDSREQQISTNVELGGFSFLIFLGIWFVVCLVAWLLGRQKEQAAKEAERLRGVDVITLGIGGTPYVLLVVMGFLCWIFVAVVLLGGIYSLLRPLGVELSESLLVITVLLISVAVLVVPSLVLWWRQRHGARVTWDEWGITEWDGQGARTAIPWSLLRYHTQKHRATGEPAWRELQVMDGSGRLIPIATRSESKASGCRRRFVASDPEKLEKLVRDVKERGQGKIDPLPWGRIDPHRHGKGWATSFVAGVGYACTFVQIFGISEEGGDRSIYHWSLVLAAIGFIALTLRATRPLRELWSLFRESRRLAGSTPVTLVDNTGTRLTLREAGGREHVIETADLDHPDLALYERRGAARVVLSHQMKSTGDPYRGGGGLAEAEYLETEPISKARRTRMGAVVVELSLRFGLALGVLAILILTLAR